MGSRLSRLNRPAPPSAPEPVQPQPFAPAADLPFPTDEPPKREEQHQVPPKRRTTPRIAALRKQLRGKLLSAPDEFDQMDSHDPEHQQIVRDRLRIVLERAHIQLSPHELAELESMLILDLLGFGPIDPLVHDTSYSEIMINGPEIIFAERKGKIVETEYVFDDEEHLQWTTQRIVRPLQREFNRNNPMVDARLPDGSRVHLIMPPSALQGTTVTIRKFPAKPLTVEDLIRFGSFTDEVAEFLRACVMARLNIVVSGGTGSGKTTLLNVL